MTAKTAFKKAVAAMKKVAKAQGLKVRVTSGKRSYAAQLKLYRKYLQGKSKYPVAPPGTSQHEYGLAVDVNVIPAKWQAWLGQLWVSWGFGWSPDDPIHFAFYPSVQWSNLLQGGASGVAGATGGIAQAFTDQISYGTNFPIYQQEQYTFGGGAASPFGLSGIGSSTLKSTAGPTSGATATSRMSGEVTRTPTATQVPTPIAPIGAPRVGTIAPVSSVTQFVISETATGRQAATR